MAPVYPSTHKIYVYLNDVRTDISADIIGDITGNDWGIIGNKPLDRIGNTGQLKFSLNNNTGKYTPGSLTALSGWDEGIALELELGFESNLYLFRFYVESIKPPIRFQDIVTQVVAVDWMKFATEHPIENPGALIDKRANDVLNEVLLRMPIQPRNIDFDEGINVFPVAFDVVTSQTKAYDEFVKVALSEIGYVYEIYDRQYGETLVFENAQSRTGLKELSSVPVSQANSGYLLKPDGFFIRTPANDKIILNQVTDAIIDNTIMDITSEYGKNVINHFTAWANPRRVDTSNVILFKLDNPIALGSGPEIEIKGTWADPAGGRSISAQDIIDPVITTDYLVNSEEDGSGTNISSSLVFTFKDFGSSGFTVRVIQSNVSFNGWLTSFQVRGHGVYNYNPIQAVAKNQTSIDRRGTTTETVTQKYKNNLYEARVFVEAEVNREKNPRMVLNAIRICANTSAALMTAFLNLHPGDLANFVIDKYNMDGYFYIQGVDNISISAGGIIMYDWILREALSLQSGLSNIAVEFGGVGTEDGVFFGHLPSTTNIQQRSYSLWVYRIGTTPSQNMFYMGGISDGGGMGIYGGTSSSGIVFWAKATGGQGTWLSDTTPISAGAWHHIVFTYDTLTPSTEPILYVDGAAVGVTAGNIISGTIPTEEGVEFSIGNINTPTYNYTWPFSGKIKDARVYNRILTLADAQAIYNSGVPNSSLVTDGLIFQAFAVKTSELSNYVNVALSEDMKLIDNIYGAIGTPHDNPIGRTP